MTFIFPQGHISGLTLSTTTSGSSTFGVTAGQCSDSTNALIMNFPSAFTKTTAAWAIGTGNGALDTGVVAVSSWYHAYVIDRGDTLAPDILISLSATAPTLPANYTTFRRIGSILTGGSGNFIAQSQFGDEFLWITPNQDVASGAFTSTAALITTFVPTGVQVGALVTVEYSNAGAVFCLISSPDQFDNPVSSTQFTMLTAAASDVAIFNGQVRTNTSGQIRVRTDTNTGSTANVFTRGWIDTRGRFA